MKSIKNLYKWCEEHIEITIAILSFIIITLCSQNSFLYALNIINDTNVYKTIGRGILDGLVPYKDLYDHKGPYVYLLFALLETWQPLVYILEIVVCAISLHYAYKIMQLYKKNSILSLVAFACLTYFSSSFRSAGAVEEFFFPMELYVTYLGLKYIKERQEITQKQFFLIGIYSGLMLWSKFTLLGFFVGWCIVPFVIMLKEKKYKELASNIGFIILGVIAITIPAGTYLGVNGAIPDFIQTYFIDNSHYVVEGGIFVNVVSALLIVLIKLPIQIITIVIGIIAIKRERLEKWYFISILVVMVLITYSGGRTFHYYFFPFYMFMILGLILLKKNWKSNIIIVAAMIINILNYQDLKLINNEIAEYPQYKFAKIIDTVETPTLLIYNTLDYGFFEIANVIPNCKYFFKCSIDGLAEEERNLYIKNKEVDFYICKNEEADFEGYELVAEESMEYGTTLTFYLYQLIEK